jgi:hypothetical protein
MAELDHNATPPLVRSSSSTRTGTNNGESEAASRIHISRSAAATPISTAARPGSTPAPTTSPTRQDLPLELLARLHRSHLRGETSLLFDLDVTTRHGEHDGSRRACTGPQRAGGGRSWQDGEVRVHPDGRPVTLRALPAISSTRQLGLTKRGSPPPDLQGLLAPWPSWGLPPFPWPRHVLAEQVELFRVVPEQIDDLLLGHGFLSVTSPQNCNLVIEIGEDDALCPRF